MCGGNCITPRAAGLRDGRLCFGRKRDQQRPLISTEASPDHKLNVLVDHEVGCCGTDVPTASTQTRRHRCRWMGWSSASDRDGEPRFRVTTSPSFISALTACSISYTHALSRILDPFKGRPEPNLIRKGAAARRLAADLHHQRASHVEEALIEAAISRGETVHRSPSALPQAVLGVRIAERGSRAARGAIRDFVVVASARRSPARSGPPLTNQA